MKEIVKLLNEMCDKGIINTYAIFGAVAQMRYTEAVVTLDLDILVDLPDTDSLAILSPIYQFCEEKGYHPEGEAIEIGDWPVQFLPAFDELSKEAMLNAEEADFEGIKVRVVSAAYLAVLALKVGRAKDKARIIALLDAGAVNSKEIEEISLDHKLLKEWNLFQNRFIDEN